MEEYIFEQCHVVNDLLLADKDFKARETLIKLLDYHAEKDLAYNPLVNHLIRETGLFPYLQTETSSWEEKYIYEVFKVDVGNVNPVTLHREQSLLLKKLLEGASIAVSAPTSFGKSFVIDAFIKIKKPDNVIIIVPTIALTDETRRRVYKKFGSEYKIITTTDVEVGRKNIFIFPQERAISYLDKIEVFDLLIVDEFYKASNKFDKERSPSLVKAMIKIGQKSKQRYFLAPNISELEDNPFTKDMEFIHLDFNTVYLEKHELYKEINKDAKLKRDALLKVISAKDTKSLIYAGNYTNIDVISSILMLELKEQHSPLLKQFSDWLGKHYHYNWDLTNLVERGTGVHNGRLHRSLGQIQVKLFEEKDGLNNLISTSSIIEGVNTSAENVVIWMNKNGNNSLNDFTYRNIIGRGGRMFKHFIGKIYILDKPPLNTQTKLSIDFPEEILGDIDEKKYEAMLTREQVAKIMYYQEEMTTLLGVETYNRLKSESLFQSSNAELVKAIAIDMATDPSSWNGLSYLNSPNTNHWERMLYKIINLQPGNWETRNRTFVAFIKTLRKNWFRSIPDLLAELEVHDVGINDFFKLERNVTFKFASLLKDVNTLQKEILKSKNYDISKFIGYVSHAFLPSVVFQLEEYGLPRMISKKIFNARLINFYDVDLTIHSAIEQFNYLGIDEVLKIRDLDDFDKYIITYFFDGIKTNDASII
jgi:hypothetical protein